jgi:hypothetical protein
LGYAIPKYLLSYLFKFEWGHKIQGLVGPLRVIVVLPFVNQLAHTGQRAKLVGVEQFATKRAVEAFDTGILRRLARLNPMQGNARLLTPLA